MLSKAHKSCKGDSFAGAPDWSSGESCFLVVEPSKIIFLKYNALPQKDDVILLYIGYHSIPKLHTTQGCARLSPNSEAKDLGFRV